jgi:hypothetical protein
VVCIVSAVIVYFLLTRIDLIVHGKLYYFGLRFSSDWADPYRIYMWLIYVCLVLPTTLSAFALVFSFTSKENLKAPEKKTEFELKVKPQPVAIKEVKTRENNKIMIISCPNCKKEVNRSLVILDFSGGKPKLVNVCPYCNHSLGEDKDEKCVDNNVNDVNAAGANKRLIS